MNEDFKCVAAIAEHGSISKAARSLHISQPGLSQRLKRIEDQLGLNLFNRGESPLRPTASGDVYIKYALRAINAEESMMREVQSAARRNRAKLRIGVSMARANALLAEPIVSFYESQRRCTLELHEMSTLEQLHKLFLGDEIDFAVLTPIAPDPSLYDIEFLCRERLMIACSAQLDIPQLRRVPSQGILLRQLEGIPFVLPTCGAYFDPLISRVIDVSNVQLDIAVRDCSTDLALSLVSEGLGVAIVPSTSLIGVRHVRSFELADVKAGNALRYIRRNDPPASSEEALFLDILRDSIQRTH